MTSPDLRRLAATIGDASRIRMLALLMEGRALTAKEMALGAHVEPSTATAHLRRLIEDKLVVSTSQGRQKYFKLAGEEVARLIETMMQLAPRQRSSSEKSSGTEPIRRARYCYDHLAGGLGTALLVTLLRKKWLVPAANDAWPKAMALTAKGDRAMGALGIEVPALYSKRRQLACTCLDWSERRDHLGGALGAALALRFTELGWIQRKKHSRVVQITADGAAHFNRLGVELAD